MRVSTERYITLTECENPDSVGTAPGCPPHSGRGAGSHMAQVMVVSLPRRVSGVPPQRRVARAPLLKIAGGDVARCRARRRRKAPPVLATQGDTKPGHIDKVAATLMGFDTRQFVLGRRTQ